MSEDKTSIDEVRKELEEIRRLKETLKKEIEEVRLEKEQQTHQEETDSAQLHAAKAKELARAARIEAKRARKEARRIAREKGRKHERRLPPIVDLSGITEGLEAMMEDIGTQIDDAFGSIDEIDAKIKMPTFRMKTHTKREKDEFEREIELIPPEQVAKVVSPLGHEERLRILDFLKDGGKTFKEIEEHIGKTGSSLTHHLNPLLDAKYLVKGAVRGTYYVTVEGRLAYRLAQWLTHRVENQRLENGDNKSQTESEQPSDNEEPIDETVDIQFEDDDTDDFVEDDW
ncbi:MAG: ArsR family transcriptional regulator [Candidatus Lokiarchaeota archaeon]|nr:ArsR family transcriptional regulator [Candidatus Lokiarchaeota archaeon]